LKAKFLKLIKELLTTALLKELLVNFIKRLIGLTSGAYGFIAGIVISRLVSWGILEAKKAVNKEQIEDKNEKIREHYEKVINNPESSQSDIDSATESFLGVRVRRVSEGDSKRP
jgi:hypothetical protein